MTETIGIGELARQADLAPSTLRYYERCGLLQPDQRDGHGRRYRPRALRRLRVIRYLQQAGFSLSEIGRLLEGGADWPRHAMRKRDEVTNRIEALRAARDLIDAALECGCTDLEGCPVHDELDVASEFPVHAGVRNET